MRLPSLRVCHIQNYSDSELANEKLCTRHDLEFWKRSAMAISFRTEELVCGSPDDFKDVTGPSQLHVMSSRHTTHLSGFFNRC
jgi:hypothetical protein